MLYKAFLEESQVCVTVVRDRFFRVLSIYTLNRDRKYAHPIRLALRPL